MGFDSRGATHTASLRRYWQWLSCQTEPLPAVSKMVLPLAIAETIRDADITSRIRYLIKGKKCYVTATGREKREYMRETTLQTPRSLKKEGRRCSRSRYSPAAQEDHVKQVTHCMVNQTDTMGNKTRASIHTAYHRESHITVGG